MKIGVAGPNDLSLLRDLFPQDVQIPKTISFPLIADLVRSFHNRGHEIAVFALSPAITTSLRIRGRRITAYICPQRRPRYQMLDFFRSERRGLRDAMRGAGCDVIHAHWTYEFGWAAVASGVPHVVTAHDIPTVVLRFARHPYWIEKPLLAWSVLRSAKSLTAVSPYVADALKSWTKKALGIVVVPNGVTKDVFDLSSERLSRQPEECFTFGSILNEWSERKNAKRLLEGFAVVRREFGTKVRLVMFGGSYGRGESAEMWAMRRGLADGVEFMGSQPYRMLMQRLAQMVDVMVHPALAEAHCMAVNEAMAIGVPVIGGASCAGVAWALDNGEAGLLVDVRSGASIAQGMRGLIVDSGLCARLGQAGRRKALAGFRLEQTVEKYEQVLMDAQAAQR